MKYSSKIDKLEVTKVKQCLLEKILFSSYYILFTKGFYGSYSIRRFKKGYVVIIYSKEVLRTDLNLS